MLSLHDESQHFTGLLTGQIIAVGHWLISDLQEPSKRQVTRAELEHELDWPKLALSH